jgi:hypothetical protein
MIKPLTLISGLLMAGAIGHTFEVKRSVAVLDRELRDIRRATEEVEARTQLLQAEWARLNDQDRLRALSERHLTSLVPMQPAQFQRLDEAARRLPVAVAWAGTASPFAPRVEAPVALAEARPAPTNAATTVQAATVAVAPTPAAPPAAPAPVLAAAAPRVAPAAPARAAEPAAPRPAQLADAAAPRAPAPRPTPVLPEAAIRAPAAPPSPAQSLPPVAAPPAPRQPAFAAEIQRPAPPAVLAEARRAPAPRPQDSAALPPVASPIRPAVHIQRVDTGSLLGGQSGTLAPPVPYNR